jgi:dTDP-glucose 4,6-dehydratase
MVVLVTGGAGFIGSAVVRDLLSNTGWRVVNVDCLTYASDPEAADWDAHGGRYAFERADVCDGPALRRILREHRPDAILHLAAESHVDRSIDGPAPFIRTNVVGTGTLLAEAREHWSGLGDAARGRFRFVGVSTDEVYGDLDAGRPPADESAPYRPSSPYAASKAAADHLVRAWHRTWGFPAIVTNCSNNYGPRQFPEKLIPHMVLSAIAGRPMPVYGRGDQVRDWIHVDDHARGLRLALERGVPGETYNFGGSGERRNIDVVHAIAAALEELAPGRRPAGGYASLVRHVEDRPGHDRRYAIDAAHARRALGWSPMHGFGDGLRATVAWYLDNEAWWTRILAGSYRLERIGR